MSDDVMGSLAALDSYDPNPVDWSRLNQPFGTLKDTNPVLHRLPSGAEIRQNDINQAIDMAMGFSGGGMATKPVVPKPLTEKQFYNQYSQHLDLRGRAAGNADEIARQIAEAGFRRSGNVNTLPAYRGGAPQNIVDMKLAPKAGDTVYLVPNSATTEMGNGRIVNEGWRPLPHEIIKVSEDYPALYQEYLKALKGK